MNPPSSTTAGSPKQKASILLDVESVERLIDSESSPFAGPHLHADVAERIMMEARNIPDAGEITVIFRVPAGSVNREREVTIALHHYGHNLHQEATRELKEILRDGRLSLVVGSVAVLVLLSITELLPLLGDSATLNALGESLIIFYWVILWRPAELLLYDHIAPRRRRRVARMLERAEVRFVEV